MLKQFSTNIPSRRHELVILGCAAVICSALPLVAQSNLERKVHVDLAGAASDAIGAPVRLGQVSVGLTGTLEISDVRVSNIFSAKRVIASVSPTSIGPRRLAANEILVESPKAKIRMEKDGSSNLDALLAARKIKRRSPAASTGTSRRSMIEQVRLVDGSLDLELVGRGHVNASAIGITMRGNQVHGVFGETQVKIIEGEWQLEGTLPHSAFDYERHGSGLKRVLANGGALQLSGPRGKALLQELTFSHRIGAHHWQMSARTGVDRATGSVLVQASPRLDGLGLTIEVQKAPLALVGPWLPLEVNPKETTVSGSLLLTKGRTLQADVALNIQKLDIGESGFSTRPMRMDLEVRGHALVRKSQGSYIVDSQLRSLRSSDLEMTGTVSGEWQVGSLFPKVASINLALAEVECDAALNALPTALRPMLAGLELRGRIASQLQVMLSRDNPTETNLEVVSGIDGCSVVREPPSADTLALTSEYEHRSPDGQAHLMKKGAPGFTAIRQMPSFVPKAFVAAEDARFFHHDGFDPHQIERSIAIDVQQGRFVRGGSTISQQLIKNLFLHRKRTLARKLQEAALTWRLESNVDKDRILEIYLNIIEFGDQNTYGITAAAERWFGVSPSELTVLQTAFLAAIVPEPESMSARIREANGLDAVSAGRVATILRAMKRGRVISKREYKKAKRQSLQFASNAVALR